jgi:hypothetical protein
MQNSALAFDLHASYCRRKCVLGMCMGCRDTRTSKRAIFMIKLLCFTVLLSTAAWAQPPAGTRDFLPLAVGNRWLYGYTHEAYAYTEYYSDRIDSGQVEVLVTGVTVYPYYNIWHLQETANYRTRLWQHSGGAPSQDSIVHSELQFDVQELLQDQHVVINQGGSWIFRFVFPNDTSTIFRYAVPSSPDLNRYTPPTAYNSGATYQRSLVFRAEVGVDSMGYQIKYSSSSGNVGAARLLEYSPATVGIKEDDAVVRGFELEQNYPNPFNPSTIIKYTIAGAGSVSANSGDRDSRSALQADRRGQGLGARNVELKVYDLLGREVATLVNERQAPGSYKVHFDGSGLASGIYFYRLVSGDFVQTRTLCLIK